MKLNTGDNGQPPVVVAAKLYTNANAINYAATRMEASAKVQLIYLMFMNVRPIKLKEIEINCDLFLPKLNL